MDRARRRPVGAPGGPARGDGRAARPGACVMRRDCINVRPDYRPPGRTGFRAGHPSVCEPDRGASGDSAACGPRWDSQPRWVRSPPVPRRSAPRPSRNRLLTRLRQADHPNPVRLARRRRPDGAGGALAAGAVAAVPRPVGTEHGRATYPSLRTGRRRPRSHRPGDRVSARRRPAAILRPGGPIATRRRPRRAPAPAEWPGRTTGPDHHQPPLDGQPSTSRPSPSSPRSVTAARPPSPSARFAVPPRHRPRPLATAPACPVPLPRPPCRRVRRTSRHPTPADRVRPGPWRGRTTSRPARTPKPGGAGGAGAAEAVAPRRDWSRRPSVSRVPSMPRPWSAVGAVSARVGPSVAT